MVTKAIERAQTTVETRNAEIRKNVLKYDEVMNEQRKVIYARRDQILEGADLKAAAMEYLNEAVDALLETYCASPAADEWDVDGLSKELRTFWPTTITEERLAQSRNTKEMAAVIDEDATAHYERREEELTPTVMREVERQVMLRIIDQRWREHLEEMDYLKEGINLRAMGQKDPLTEWQREGFEMFGSMMKGIAQDFVRYVMHVQVVRQDQQQTQVQAGPAAAPSQAAAPAAAPAAVAPAPARAAAPAVSNLQQTSSDTDRVSGFAAAAAAAPADEREMVEAASAAHPGTARAAGGRAARRQQQAPKQETVVKDEWSKTPRNAPCPCGSGKKFKLCHGG
jgi:preprotein translocase subunit SecA